MPDTIVDSKFRILEPLAKLAGRHRYLVSDLISSELAVLETAPLEGAERVPDRWSAQWLPALRERAARFATRPSFVPVTAVGVWNGGPYYVYAAADPALADGRTVEDLPPLEAVRRLLEDLSLANDRGDHVLNLRPEYLLLRGDRLLVLPGAFILPLELLVRTGPRSPYQPLELRHAGLLGPATDGFEVGAVLAALVERSTHVPPPWLAQLSRMQVLEPTRRVPAGRLALELGRATADIHSEPVRRGVERLADLRDDASSGGNALGPVLEAVDAGLAHLAAGRSSVLAIESAASGAGLRGVLLQLRERLCFLAERPRVVWIDPLSAWEPRDIGAGAVLLVPDWLGHEVELLPVAKLLGERIRPALVILGLRRDLEVPGAGGRNEPALVWLARACGTEFDLRSVMCADADETAPPELPGSSAARHLLDLLSVLEADATADMLRHALPQQEALLPQAIVELEKLGFVRRQLDAGGWWGSDARLVLRVLRPAALAARRDTLSPERREELHLLISHLLEHAEVRTLGQRWLLFHHLFAGGNWEAAAAECDALLKGVQRRNLETVLRQVQRRVVHSNLALHTPTPRLLDLLRELGAYEVERGRLAEGQAYYERATERLFGLGDPEAGQLELDSITSMILAHAILLESRVGFARAQELVQRYLDRFGERLPPVDRGRLLAELAYCELRLGHFTAAEERSQVALKLLDARRNPQDVAHVYNVLGSIRWKTSRYEEAEQYFTTCMALREKTGDRLGVARIYNNLGLLYRSMRRFPDALEYHRRSMQIRQDLGDSEGVARSVLNLAWVHFEMRNLHEAEELAARACALSEELGIPGPRAQAKGLLGEIYLACERIPAARAALAEAIHALRALGDTGELFANLRKSASVELRSGSPERAEALLLEAETLLPAVASPLEEANWQLALGELRCTQHDERRAAQAYESAGNNLARLGDAARAAEVFVIAARLYHTSGVASRARDLAERARQLYAREGTAIPPRDLSELEATLGAGETAPAAAAETGRFVSVLCRAAALAASTGNEGQALEGLMQEMRGLAGALHAVLLGRDRQPHRMSLLAREGGAEPPLVLENQRLATHALQSLVPFASTDWPGEKLARPFYVLPVEAREQSLGCIYLEWPPDGRLPDDAVSLVLRALAQHVAMLLERSDLPPPAPPVLSETASLAPAAGGLDRDEPGLEALVGRSAARQAILDFVRQVRDLEATVLIMGENGTGKEVVSRGIHFTGVRRSEPFVTINCTAIPAALWERELFGHERGSFTDAHERKRGYFETAHRGTMLLDEIGDMPWEMQTKFLRVLEAKSFTRIGGTEPLTVDVRILAATNQDLEAAVQAGRFRRDLFHRLNVLTITLPPLRERREDIPLLARYFLERHAERMGVRPKRLSGEALRILMRYPWPGNVRELENSMKGSLVLSNRDVLLPEDLPAAVLRGGDTADTGGELDIDSVARWVLDHAAYSSRIPLMPTMEKALARQLVAKVGEKTMAARLLGISKPTLYTRLKS